MAKNAKQTEKTAEEKIVDAAEAAANAAPKSNFTGSIEEAFDDAFAEGAKEGDGRNALLNLGRIAMRNAHALYGKNDKEMLANMLALRLKYVEGVNAKARNPLERIETVGEKAEKANKTQASKLGTLCNAGRLFKTSDEAVTYFDRVEAAVNATDYSKAKTRESTFERVKRAMVKLDALAAEHTEEQILERVKPEVKAEATTTDAQASIDEATAAANAAPEPSLTETAQDIAARISVMVAKFSPKLSATENAKLMAMADELSALAKLKHAADSAEANADAAKTEAKAA